MSAKELVYGGEKHSVISVVIPVYNVERFIKRCIDSVIAQTYEYWEMILVDDGSPDYSGVICDEYAQKDKRIRVIHQKNGGVSVARNKGIDYCTGKYIYFLDSDDFIMKDTFQFMVSIAEENQSDIVMTGIYELYPNGMRENTSGTWLKTNEVLKIQKDILLDRLPNFACGKLYRLDLWKNLRFPVGVQLEDMATTCHAFFKAKRIHISSKPCYVYSKENPTSITLGIHRNYVKLKYGSFRAWKEHEFLAKKHMPECQDFCVRKVVHAAIRAIMLDRIQKKLNSEEIWQMYLYLKECKCTKLPLSLIVSKYFILHNIDFMVYFLGYLQQNVLDMQDKRRQKKLGKGKR